MKDRKMEIEVVLPITSKKKMFYSVVTPDGEIIANIGIHAFTKRNEFDDTYSLILEYTMEENTMYQPSQQEINSADFLFSNLVKVLQWDISSVIDIDLSRINDILPIDTKIVKIRKGEKICQNVVN